MESRKCQTSHILVSKSSRQSESVECLPQASVLDAMMVSNWNRRWRSPLRPELVTLDVSTNHVHVPILIKPNVCRRARWQATMFCRVSSPALCRKLEKR